jgi:hypothetical protein
MNYCSLRSFIRAGWFVWFFILFSLCATVATAQENFTTWNKRMSITLSGYTPPAVAETLTNFPVLVVLSNTPAGSGFSYADFLTPPYGDLRFSTTTNGTPLNYEVETWNTNGNSFIWVQVPAVTDATTTIWAFWGKGATLPVSATNGATWSNAYLGVWHMATNTSAMTDSSTNRRGSAVSGTIATVPGMGGNACDFTPTAYFSASNNFPALATSYTVSAWINMDANASNFMGIVGAYNNNNFILALTGTVRYLSFFDTAWRTSSNTLPSGAWKHVGYTRSSTTGVFYVNGTRVFAVTNAVASALGGLLQIGNAGSTWINPFDGRIDEVQVSSVDRSSNWMSAAYLSLANSAFVTYGNSDNGGRPVVSNDTAVSDMSGVATVNGILASTGSGTDTKVFLLWGTTDGGPTFGAWANTNQLADGTPVGPISCGVTGVIGATYYYRYYATNSIGDTWATPALTFSVGLLPVTKTWSATAGSDSNWFVGSNWTPAGVPTTGDVVLIDSSMSTITNISLTNSTDMLGALIISNRYLTCSNWTTTINATNIIIRSGGVMRLPGPSITNAMTNIIHLVCSNLTIDAGGFINADYGGYWASQGPGKGNGANGTASGGGHGGKGVDTGTSAGGVTNDVPDAPTLPGSGGAKYLTETNGHGGGVIRIEATNIVVNGTVSADGQGGGQYSGGGAGGSIFITCKTFGGGTSGVIRARGGYGGYGNQNSGGGGGRIAIIYAVPPVNVGVQYFAAPGTKYAGGGFGTLYLPDTTLVRSPLTTFQSVRLVIPNFNSWVSDSLVVSNCMVSFGDGDFTLTVSNNLTIWSNSCLALGGVALSGTQALAGVTATATNPIINIGGSAYLAGGMTVGGAGQINRMEMSIESNLTIAGGALVIGGSLQTKDSILNVTGNLTLTNAGYLTAWSGRTNLFPSYGGRVGVSGLTSIATNSWIISGSHPTNGATVLFDLKDLIIQPGGGFDATAKGFAWNGVVCNGPGKGNTTGGARGSGGGYGGLGGSNGVSGGITYGVSNAPLTPGSPGGYGHVTGIAQPGGGAIRINAGMLTLNGTIMSTGGSGGGYGGGGSGGGIFITCTNISGAGVVTAIGGSSLGQGGTPAGGGGGGRISIGVGLSDAAISNLIVGSAVSGLVNYRTDSRFLGTLSASNGLPTVSGFPGATGTFQIVAVNSSSLTINGFPSPFGHPHPDAYGTVFTYGQDSWVTNTVYSPDDEANGIRHACLGWELRTIGGALSNSLATTQAVFKLTENLILNWYWTNQYSLAIAAGPNGSVNSGTINNWYTNAFVVTGILATADSGYKFDQWTGSAVPAGQETNNPLTVTMDRVRTNILANFAVLGGTTKTWTGAGVWESPTNWTPSGMPGIDDTVIIQSGTSILSSARQFAYVTVSNGATLMFTNWNTSLTASNITVLPTGTITLPLAFSNNVMSNRVYLICTNFILEAGGQILADGRGYAAGQGPSAGTAPGSRGSGGGHGGRGGDSYGTGGVTNDSSIAPEAPGSGGGYFDATGGAGGGAVRINASGNAVINGNIFASGQDSVSYGGGGAGGAVWISCTTFSGTTGVIRVNGGKGGIYSPSAAGGGGRISIVYGSLAGTVGVQFSALASSEYYTSVALPAGMGTLYLPDTALLANGVGLFNGLRLNIPGFNSWNMDSLTLNNRSLSFADGDFRLTITNNLTLQNNAWLALGGIALSTGYCDAATSSQTTSLVISVGGNVVLDGSMLTMGGNASTSLSTMAVGSNLTLMNGGQLFVYSGTTNNTRDYGALVNIAGSLTMTPTNSWIFPFAQPTNGGAPLFKARTLVVSSNTGFNADFIGFKTHRGPGVGGGSGSGSGGGGGYGGQGGHGSGLNGGPANGSTNIPIRPGSGGGGTYDEFGGNGGGAIRLELTDTVTLNGTLTANGQNGGTYNGGGSGGAIFIMCGGTFVGGTSAVLRANGGNGGSGYTNLGGGGGGRISIVTGVPEETRIAFSTGSNTQLVVSQAQIKTYLGSTNVVGGTNVLLAAFGQTGTMVFFKYNPSPGTIFILQ